MCVYTHTHMYFITFYMNVHMWKYWVIVKPFALLLGWDKLSLWFMTYLFVLNIFFSQHFSFFPLSLPQVTRETVRWQISIRLAAISEHSYSQVSRQHKWFVVRFRHSVMNSVNSSTKRLHLAPFPRLYLHLIWEGKNESALLLMWKNSVSYQQLMFHVLAEVKVKPNESVEWAERC